MKPDIIPEKTKREAAEWFLELNAEPVTPMLRSQWNAWLDARPENELAWQQLNNFSSRLRQIDPELARQSLNAPTIAGRRYALKSLAVLAMGCGAWQAIHFPYVKYKTSDYHTGLGEIRTIKLDDGTELILNAETAVNVQFNHDRRVQLLSGEILITTAENGSQPWGDFIVETAQGTVRALGTRFMVSSFSPEKSNISVFQGAVELKSRRLLDNALIVNAGEAGHITPLNIRVTGQANEHSIAWHEGMLIAQDEPLAVFLSRLSRYLPGYFHVAESAESVRVSGSFRLDNRQHILQILQTAYALKVTRTRRWWGEESFLFNKQFNT
ncbi:FecR domain-containing protein [Oceanimonas baumannii]|uniref:FecR domain-containing protein n=1 Tax=Oceanimonas baumannii TaxID=129578 RepID=UPI001D186068|nr:FecR domain-containing protein [Oceanimonas baumannii]MCC4263623.1 FecR domain-containing protein [Oceanimonas baumannii]